MPLPPILEVYVLWHPDDGLGAEVAGWLTEHFHSAAYAGLAGGAVEVYLRSVGWEDQSAPPRPLPFMQPLPAGLPTAQITAVVPVLGTGLARAVQGDPTWRAYMEAVFAADRSSPDVGGEISALVGVYPLRDPDADLNGAVLTGLAARQQALPQEAAESPATLARELSQAIAQRLHTGPVGVPPGPGLHGERITVFVSHTKHHTVMQQEDGPQLLEQVREVLRNTRLGEFFDAHDLQIGSDWERALDAAAGSSALLMVRTDLYSGREWTQREVLTAKQRDVPVVALFAVRQQEDRGSFLMDHVPVIPCHPDDARTAIERALNRLVDESLKRALWQQQSVYLRRDGFDWLPGHAPEPITVVPWLRQHRAEDSGDPHVWIMHPDPPLGPRETEVIVELCALAGFTEDVDILTPRTFANRGGRIRP
ncbi:toll/interleukin-1 receptor domain-containing protein [Modestobacter sp. SYSU DS0875]